MELVFGKLIFLEAAANVLERAGLKETAMERMTLAATYIVLIVLMFVRC